MHRLCVRRALLNRLRHNKRRISGEATGNKREVHWTILITRNTRGRGSPFSIQTRTGHYFKSWLSRNAPIVEPWGSVWVILWAGTSGVTTATASKWFAGFPGCSQKGAVLDGLHITGHIPQASSGSGNCAKTGLINDLGALPLVAGRENKP